MVTKTRPLTPEQPTAGRLHRRREVLGDTRVGSSERDDVAVFPSGRFDLDGLSPQAILALQRTAGNRAVTSLVASLEQRGSPRPLQRGHSPNPNLKVTPISPNPNLKVTPIPPTVAWISRQRRAVDGTQLRDTDRMRVGEYLIVRLLLDNVEADAVRRMGSMIVSDALTRESLTVEESGAIQVVFRAVKIGNENVEMRFSPAGTEASDDVVTHVRTHVEMGQEDFGKKLQEATLYANNSYHAANLYMAKAGRPYREAWEHVKQTLERAYKKDPFNETVLELVVTFLAGLKGGEVVEAVKECFKTSGGAPVLASGLKEFTMRAIEAGVQAVMPREPTGFPQDPADWADAAREEIEAHALSAGTTLENATKANNENKAGFYRDFDAVEEVKKALTFHGQQMRSLETAAIPSAEDFEKDIWKAWLVAYGATGHGPDPLDDGAWAKIVHRIFDLGEDGLDYIKIYIGKGFEQSQKERARKGE